MHDDSEDDDYWRDEEADDFMDGPCCCPGRCLNPHWHHFAHECYTRHDLGIYTWHEMIGIEMSRLWRLLLDAWAFFRQPHAVCTDCGKPERRWWRAVGEHEDEDHLPF